jgi:Fur family transcriptional regulator, ferric uptake regulator
METETLFQFGADAVPAEPPAQVDGLLAALIQAGYHNTRARRAVLQALVDARGQATPNELLTLGREFHSELGLVTVYRTLDILSELGLVRKLHLQHGCHTYAVSPAAMQAAGHPPAETPQPAALPEQHAHHIICQQCQRAVEFAGCDIAAVVAQVEAQTGYRVRDHWLEMFGICPECQGRTSE